jgi:hypothetical protein
MTRQEILKAAEDCVCRDRQATHGAPENSFGKIASVWSALLGITIRDDQVTIMLNALKGVRAWDNPGHDDNWVDMAGYAACGGELVGKRLEALVEAFSSDELESAA